MVVPLGIAYYASEGAKKLEITDEAAKVALTPESFERFVDKKTQGELKVIKHKIDEEAFANSGFNFILDENFFNMFIRQLNSK